MSFENTESWASTVLVLTRRTAIWMKLALFQPFSLALLSTFYTNRTTSSQWWHRRTLENQTTKPEVNRVIHEPTLPRCFTTRGGSEQLHRSLEWSLTIKLRVHSCIPKPDQLFFRNRFSVLSGAILCPATDPRALKRDLNLNSLTSLNPSAQYTAHSVDEK